MYTNLSTLHYLCDTHAHEVAPVNGRKHLADQKVLPEPFQVVLATCRPQQAQQWVRHEALVVIHGREAACGECYIFCSLSRLIPERK